MNMAYKDMTKILLPFCARKEEFEDMPEPTNLGAKELKALSYLYDKGLVIEIPKRASAFDTVFKSPGSSFKTDQEMEDYYTAFPTEWIVIRGDEFFYVDNEGYDYCRYGFKIPEDVLNAIID